MCERALSQQLPHCANAVRHMGGYFLVGGLSWFQVRMVKAAVVGCGPRLTHKTHTQAKSLCDHSNEAESAEPLAKPQQHFTIALPQLCVCVCRLELNACQPATATNDEFTEMAVIAYDNEEMQCSHNSGQWVIDKQTASAFSVCNARRSVHPVCVNVCCVLAQGSKWLIGVIPVLSH